MSEEIQPPATRNDGAPPWPDIEAIVRSSIPLSPVNFASDFPQTEDTHPLPIEGGGGTTTHHDLELTPHDHGGGNYVTLRSGNIAGPVSTRFVGGLLEFPVVDGDQIYCQIQTSYDETYASWTKTADNDVFVGVMPASSADGSNIYIEIGAVAVVDGKTKIARNLSGSQGFSLSGYAADNQWSFETFLQ